MKLCRSFGYMECKGVNDIVSAQEVDKGMEGDVVLMNNVWHSAVIDFGCVSS